MNKYFPLMAAIAITLLALTLSITHDPRWHLGMIIAVLILAISNFNRGEEIESLTTLDANWERYTTKIENEANEEIRRLNKELGALHRKRAIERERVWMAVKEILRTATILLQTPDSKMNSSWAAGLRHALAGACLRIVINMGIDTRQLGNSLWARAILAATTKLLRSQGERFSETELFNPFRLALNKSQVHDLYRVVLIAHMHNIREKRAPARHPGGLDLTTMAHVAANMMNEFHHQSPQIEASFFSSVDVQWLDSLADEHRNAN